MTHEEKIKQLNIKIKEKNDYIKKRDFDALFTLPQFKIEFFFLLTITIIFAFMGNSGEKNTVIALTTFLLICPIVVLKNLTTVSNIKKTCEKDVQILSDILNKESIPDVIVLSYDKKINLGD